MSPRYRAPPELDPTRPVAARCRFGRSSRRGSCSRPRPALAHHCGLHWHLFAPRHRHRHWLWHRHRLRRGSHGGRRLGRGLVDSRDWPSTHSERWRCSARRGSVVLSSPLASPPGSNPLRTGDGAFLSRRQSCWCHHRGARGRGRCRSVRLQHRLGPASSLTAPFAYARRHRRSHRHFRNCRRHRYCLDDQHQPRRSDPRLFPPPAAAAA